MGCGKTLAAIAVAGAGFRLGYIHRVLVVAPASVVPVWPQEFYRYAGFPHTVRALTGTRRQRLQVLQGLKDFVYPYLKVAVTNYEAVRSGDIYDALEAYAADLIICDESQRIKTHNAEQSRAMHRLGDAAPYRMILSGTPVQNEAVDLWSQYRFLDPSVFGTNFYLFRNRYCVMGGFNRKQIIRYQNTDDLIRREHSIAYRVTKEEALDLPEQTFENRAIPLGEKEAVLYNRLRRDSFAELSDGGTVTATTILTRLLRLQQFTGGFLPEDEGGPPKQVSTAKLSALEDIIQDYVIDGRHKLVVFARFIPEIHAIEALANRLFSRSGMKAVSLYGETKQDERGPLVEQFQADPQTVLFIGQIDTAGAGITLTAANTAVYYSLTFNYAAYTQSASRIHRIGQHNRCTYIHLLCDKTVDMQILKALQGKEDLAKNIVDRWRDLFREPTE